MFFSFQNLVEKVSSLLCEPALQISSKVFIHALYTVRIYADRVPFTAQRRSRWSGFLLGLIVIISEKLSSLLNERHFSHSKVFCMLSLLRCVLLEWCYLHKRSALLFICFKRKFRIFLDSAFAGDIELLDQSFQVLVALHQVANRLLVKFLIGLQFINFHIQKFDVFVFFHHLVKQFQGFLSENDKLPFQSLYFFCLIWGGVGFFGIFVFELLHFLTHSVKMAFVSKEKLWVMALNDLLDLVLDCIDILDQLCMVFYYLLFACELFRLRDKCRFALVFW